MTFHIGQKVIAIKTFERGQRQGFNVPQKHQIYTIRAFCPNASSSALLFHEIYNSKIVRFVGTNNYGEPSFAARFFRPLVDLHEVFSISTPAPKQKEHNGTD